MRAAGFLLLLALAAPLVPGESLGDIHLGKNGFIARTCLDYLQHGIFENGFHWLFDDQNQRYVAYCDLSSEPGTAWTLVVSWNRASKNLPHFRSKTFLEDAPINHNNPNWSAYRLTLARMKTLRSRSTHWRATCSFNRPRFQNLEKAIDYRDYLRGKFSNFDIMTFLGYGKCFPVEYVNIRGHAAGNGTTAQFWQVQSTFTLHISRAAGCAFKPNAGAVYSEDNFGYYDKINTNFRCTAGDEATTQWWFGGYLD